MLGGWASTYSMWNSQLCCTWGTFGYFSVPTYSALLGISIVCTKALIQERLCLQVLNDKGYDGTASDVWSCGVILFVLMAGYLPFDEPNIMTLYKKVNTQY